jgi:hypothetical protein
VGEIQYIDLAWSPFSAVRATSAKFGVPAGKMKFSTQNEV